MSSLKPERNPYDEKKSERFVFGPWETESEADILRRAVVLGFRMEAVKTECSDRGLLEKFDDCMSCGREYFESLRLNLIIDDVVLPDGEIIGPLIDCKR